MPDPFDRVAIVGCGLIGGSVARGLRARGLARHVAVAERPPALARVEELGFADSLHADPAEAAAGADLAMLCVPVGAMAGAGAAVAPALRPGAILTDVGSTKGSVLRDLLPLMPPGAHLVPGHPMAGTEHSGPDAGFAELFEGRWCLLTPPPGADRAAVERVAALWRDLGASVREMDAAHHDRTVAMVSHLPHLIAFTICGTADTLQHEAREEVLDYAASGFRDFTRIAASDPVMWRDTFLNNREALLEMLDRFSADAAAMAHAVREGDGGYIEDRIARGRAIRRRLIERRQA